MILNRQDRACRIAHGVSNAESSARPRHAVCGCQATLESILGALESAHLRLVLPRPADISTLKLVHTVDTSGPSDAACPRRSWMSHTTTNSRRLRQHLEFERLRGLPEFWCVQEVLRF